MRFGIVYTFLSQKFEKHGRKIANHVSWFLVIPLFSTLFLATGLQNLHLDTRNELLIQSGGVIDTYKSYLMNLFPMDISSEFDPGRLLDMIRYGTVIIRAADKGSILREFIFEEIIGLDENIRNFTLSDYQKSNYTNLCAKNDGKCFQNKILLLKNKIKEIENGTFLLEYPMNEDSKDYDILSLGGVKVDKNGYIIYAETVRLFYFLDNNDWWKEKMARKWEKCFIDQIKKLKFANITVAKDVSTSADDSEVEIFKLAIAYIPYSAVLTLLFVILTCLWPDFLRSKPWIGIISAVATGMSLASGIGLLGYIGINPPASVSMVPFLVLGIGMDDTFVMMSAWMITDPKKSVEKRMAETFSETGVSITITSLTNIVSFVVGIAFTNWPIHRIFCLFMALCLIFDYIYQITFIGAFLALCGKAEERHLHSLFFLPLDKFSGLGDHNCLRKYLLCYWPTEDTAKRQNRISIIKFLQNIWSNFGNMMTKRLSKTLTILLYILYLGFALWGFTKFSYQATFEVSLIGGTYRCHYYKLSKENYHQYQYRLQIFITQELDYADPLVQQKVREMIENIESDPLIAGSSLTESWLKSYLEFLSDKRTVLFLTGYNVTKSEDFIGVLRKFFFRVPMAKRFKNDIAFDQNYTKIISTRFLFQTNLTLDADHFYSQLVNFRKKLGAAPFSAIVYHPLFYFFDIVDAIPETARNTLTIVFVTVFCISSLLLPNITCIICTLFTILSVGMGVMGYMFLWDLKLSLTSIVMLIVVVGFSVDYAAHVSVAYVSSKSENLDDRMVKAITMTAMPILQGSLTTILAIIVALNAPSMEIVGSIKIVILACSIAALHGIVFIPVVISILDFFRLTIYQCNIQRGETLNVNNEIDFEGTINISFINL